MIDLSRKIIVNSTICTQGAFFRGSHEFLHALRSTDDKKIHDREVLSGVLTRACPNEYVPTKLSQPQQVKSVDILIHRPNAIRQNCC